MSCRILVDASAVLPIVWDRYVNREGHVLWSGLSSIGLQGDLEILVSDDDNVEDARARALQALPAAARIVKVERTPFNRGINRTVRVTSRTPRNV